MFTEILCQLGFTETEIKVYLELIKIGPQAGSVIARRTNLRRTTTYTILQQMEKKGLVSSFRNKSVTLFSAVDPNYLVGFVDKKCRTFDYYREELVQMIPKLRALRSPDLNFDKPIITYHQGIEGIRYVISDILNTEAINFSVFVSAKDFIHLKDFLKKIFKKCASCRVITSDVPSIHQFFDEINREEIQIIYLEEKDFSGNLGHQMNICEDKVSFLNLVKGAEYGVLIENCGIVQMQKNIFEIVWKSAKR